MSLYNTKDKYLHTYNTKDFAFDVGENKDIYSISNYYTHNLDTDEITSKHEVIKNWIYNKLPKDQEPIPSKKYSETVFTGTLKECRDYIVNIVNTLGHWDKNPDDMWNKMFIEPIEV